MFRVPRALLSMLKLRAREPGRFALHGVFTRTDERGRQHVQVTDGRRLAAAVLKRSDGDDTDPAGSVILDGDDLGSMLKVCTKGGDLRVATDPMGEKTVGATTALRSGDVSGRVRVVPGTFPPIDAVIPKTKITETRVVDGDFLVELAKAAKDASADGRVFLTFYEGTQAVAIRSASPIPSLEDFFGLLMPIVKGDGETTPEQGPLPLCGHVLPTGAPAGIVEIAPGVHFSPAAASA